MRDVKIIKTNPVFIDRINGEAPVFGCNDIVG